MGVKEMGMQQGTGVHTNCLPSWDENSTHAARGAIIKALACHKTEYIGQEKRVGALRSQICQLDGCDEVASGRVVAQSSHADHIILEGHSISEAGKADTTEVLAMGWIVTGIGPRGPVRCGQNRSV